MNKTFIYNIMLGIGIGIILTSSLNMIFNSKKHPVNEQKQTAAISSSDLQKSIENIKDSLKENEEEKESSKEYAENLNENRNSDTENVHTPEEIIIDEIFIEKGMSSEEIGLLLKNKGIIADSNEFINAASKNKLSSQLHFGYKRIPRGSTIEEILHILSVASN